MATKPKTKVTITNLEKAKDNIIEMMKSCGSPLTENQNMLFVGAFTVWAEKIHEEGYTLGYNEGYSQGVEDAEGGA